MTQVYDAQNVLVPVTVVEAGPCTVVQVKTVAKDGYNAVQLGFAVKKTKNSSKAELNHAKLAGLAEITRVEKAPRGRVERQLHPSLDNARNANESLFRRFAPRDRDEVPQLLR